AGGHFSFAVTPAGPVDFGSVNLGAFADQTFVVRNASAGTVSGSASISAPFSIVSGSPFTLAVGASQTVTVRFSPTAAAAATANVNFTTDGDTISGIVTGTGTDTTPPTVAITSPTSNPTYSTTAPLLTLEGTASDNVGVTEVTWTNGLGSGTASGTTSWTASGIALQVGTNMLTVTARDAAGNTAVASLAVTFLPTFALTVSPSGEGTETVTSTPGDINCGASCTASFASGTVVVLTATPGASSVFLGWNGGGCTGTGPCTVTMSAATTVTAIFTPTFTLTVSPSGNGTVTSIPGDVNCGASCTARFASGTVVALTATPGASSVFMGWSGGGCTGTGPCTVTVSAATTVTATFTPIFSLTVGRSGEGTGTVTGIPGDINCGAACTASLASGTVVALAATPSASSVFAGWSGGGCTGTGPCTVTMSAAATVTATFAPTLSSLKTVFVLVLEKTSWASITPSVAPYISNTLVPMGAHAEQYFSPPVNPVNGSNYVWLEAGDTLGLTMADPSASNSTSTVAHLATYLETAGISWKAYEGNISGTSCPLQSGEGYAASHNPFVFFQDVTSNNDSNSSRCIAHNRPFSELATDLQNNAVARYNFIAPNLCDGLPDCSVTTGDTWLSNNLP